MTKVSGGRELFLRRGGENVNPFSEIGITEKIKVLSGNKLFALQKDLGKAFAVK